LWVAVSALWVLCVAIIAPTFNTPLIPSEAFVMKDATSGFFKLDNYFDRYDESFKAVHREVRFPNNVTLFVVNTVPETVVEADALERLRVPFDHPPSDAATPSEVASRSGLPARIGTWPSAARTSSASFSSATQASTGMPRSRNRIRRT